MTDSQQSGGMKTVSSDKSREVVKAESVMKAEAWVSGINTLNCATSNTDCTDSTRQLLQSSLTMSLHPDDAQLTKPASCSLVRAVIPSLLQPSVAALKMQAVTAASSLPPSLSPNNTVVERTVVKNTLNPHHLSAVVTDSAGSGIILGTPMKRVDSISASAGHLKTSAVIDHSSNTRRLHYKSNSENDVQRNDYAPNDRYTKQFDSSFGVRPEVQSTIEHYSSEASKLNEASQANLKNMQQQTSVRGSLHSIVLQNSAVGRENVNRSLTPALTVSSQSSTTQHVITASAAVNPLKTSNSGSFPSHNNARLNELWSRFNQDQTVYSPHAANSAAALSISRIELVEDGVMDFNVQQSKYQHPVKHAAGEKSQDTEMVKKQQQQSSSSVLSSSSLPDYSSLPSGNTTNVVHPGHHNLAFDRDSIQQHNAKPLHNSYGSHASTGNKEKLGNPSKPDDIGKETSFSASVPVKHAWIVRDETLPVVPEDTTLGSVTSDFTSTSSVDDLGNVITRTTKRHLPNDPKLLRLQQKIAQQREKHRQVRRNEDRRKEHIVKMELALRERQKAIEQETGDLKKTKDDHNLSSNQLQITASSTTLTTVTSNDSDVTLCSSSLQPDDHLSLDNSQLLSAFDTSGNCSCQQARCEISRVFNTKAKKRHKSEMTFKPKLHEVRYTKSKVTKSAPTVLSHETSSHEQERNARRKVPSFSASYRTRVPETAVFKNAHGDRSPSKASALKTNCTSRILTEKNKQVTAEHSMQSKAVQTTPRLRDNTVLYASAAVQCPTVSSHFDELGVISLPVVSRSLSCKVFSPGSSSDADGHLLQHLKHKSLMKPPVRVSVPRELLLVVCERRYTVFALF